jgi:hypothetical protein
MQLAYFDFSRQSQEGVNGSVGVGQLSGSGATLLLQKSDLEMPEWPRKQPSDS